MEPEGSIEYDTIFIYCSWVAIPWQWFLHLYTKGKNSNIHEEKQYRSQNNADHKTMQITKHTKWKAKHKTIKQK